MIKNMLKQSADKLEKYKKAFITFLYFNKLYFFPEPI